MNETLVYVGTYTGAKSKGIYLFRLQTTGLEVSQNITLVPLGLAAESPNPVLPRARPETPAGLRGQRARQLPGQADRRGQRVLDRSGQRQAERC